MSRGVDARPLGRDRSLLGPDPNTVGPDPDTSDGSTLRPGRDMHDDRHESALTPYLPERWRAARLDPGHRGMLALCGVGVIVLAVAGFAVMRDSPAVAPVPALPVVAPLAVEPSGSAETPEAVPEKPALIVVSVVGLVSSSGLVHLPPESRIADALAAAGGPLAGADVLALNLAAKLSDGDQIVVGAVPVEGRPTVSATMKDDGAGPESNASQGTAGGSGGAVNLNTATVAELDTLSGVGPVTAANIIAWRDSNGPFTDVGQLAEVDGIGPVRLDKLRPQVTV